MAHDGKTRREATHRRPEPGSSDRAPEPGTGPGPGAGRAGKPAGVLAQLDLGPAKPAKPTPVTDDPPRKFFPPEGVTRKIGPESAGPPDIPLPSADADRSGPLSAAKSGAKPGRPAAKVGAGGPPPDIPLPRPSADWAGSGWAG